MENQQTDQADVWTQLIDPPLGTDIELGKSRQVPFTLLLVSKDGISRGTPNVLRLLPN